MGQNKGHCPKLGKYKQNPCLRWATYMLLWHHHFLAPSPTHSFNKELLFSRFSFVILLEKARIWMFEPSIWWRAEPPIYSRNLWRHVWQIMHSDSKQWRMNPIFRPVKSFPAVAFVWSSLRNLANCPTAPNNSRSSPQATQKFWESRKVFKPADTGVWAEIKVDCIAILPSVIVLILSKILQLQLPAGCLYVWHIALQTFWGSSSVLACTGPQMIINLSKNLKLYRGWFAFLTITNSI